MQFKARVILAPVAAVAVSILASSVAFPASAASSHHGHGSCRLPPAQKGKAMFYGDAFHGRTMANGQKFDMNAMTAASRTLPLGTKARVTNLKTHRSVVLTITDRGALRAPGVILDMSVGAARAVGLTEKEGVAPVSIVPIGFTGNQHCS
jgi:rare lipoprotein A